MSVRARVITLNGPLGSGKSWVVDQVFSGLKQGIYANRAKSRIHFADPVREASMALLGLDPRVTNYDTFKRTDYLGKSGRQWMIDLSEDFCKRHDPDFFAKILAERIRRDAAATPAIEYSKLYFCDSNGFESELLYLMSQQDFDVLACSIEPRGCAPRGQKYQENDSRHNLAHMCHVVATDSSTLLTKMTAAIQRRGWV